MMKLVRTVLVVGVLLSAVPTLAQTPAPLSNADLVKMAQAGLPEAVILQTIRANPASFDLSPAGLVSLKSAGVSDAVIAEAVMRGRAAAPTIDRVTPSKVTVPDATELKLRLMTPVSSATARQEDALRFEVVEDITVSGVVVFAKGAEAKGRISEVQRSRSFGRSGKLNFSIDSVMSTDGTSVPIRTSRELKGDARVGATVAAVALVGVFGGFVKGKNIDAPAGSEYTVFTDGVREISSKAGTK